MQKPDPSAVPARVLFLDLDGVLNSTRSCLAFNGYPSDLTPLSVGLFDPVALGLVRGLCRGADVSVVLSSSWRILHSWDDVGRALDLPVFDSTPRLSGRRGEEIDRWLLDHPGVETWAILDDDADMLPSQASRFVRTDSHDGLLWRDFVRLCGIFGVDPHDCPGTHVRVVAGRALDWPVLV